MDSGGEDDRMDSGGEDDGMDSGGEDDGMDSDGHDKGWNEQNKNTQGDTALQHAFDVDKLFDRYACRRHH
eukprot:4506140-Prymnesium_polylepis.2